HPPSVPRPAAPLPRRRCSVRQTPPPPACIRSTEPAESKTVRLGDDLLHDLVGTRTDPRQAGVAPRPLNRKLAHVTVAAEDLDRVVRDLAGDLRRQQLGLRELAHRVLAIAPALRRLINEGPRGRDLRATIV